MPLASGTRLGNYEIKSLLGTGGMGEVYLVHDAKLKRRVALKLLPTDQTPSRDRLSRFEREAYAVSSLNHPNILTIHEIGEAEGRRFIVSEFIEGQSLREYMARGPMGLMEAINTAIQVASALSAAHQAGIVHRDIKPENIMIRKDGLVKVLDFGLAKLLNKDSLGESDQVDRESPTQTMANTGAGQILGTITYMSPEQTRGPHIDERGDIWSLGVVLYEMITGQTPFNGETQSDMIAAILKTEPPPMHESAPETPPELQRIVTRMLCKDRSMRYQGSHDVEFSLKELKQDLELRERLDALRPASANADSRANSGSGGPKSTSITEQTPARPQVSSIEFFVSEIKRRKVSVTLVLFVIVTGLAATAYFTRETPASPIDSIAVLPFSNESGDPNLEYLSDGISEGLINRLSQTSQLKLIARSSSFKYKGKQIDPEKVANELGVEALVIGRVTQHGDDLAVKVELVDTRSMTQLWGQTYDRKTSDLQSIATEISQKVLSNLRLKSAGEEQKRFINNSTNNADAYQLYLKGRFNWNKLTKEGLEKSIEFFQGAVEKDPQYALAYAGLADSYVTLGANYLPPTETYPKAIFFAQKALEIDDTLAEAHYAMAVTKLLNDWNLPETEKELSRALELNPNHATAYSLRSSVSLARGQTNDAIVLLKRALELDPFSLLFNLKLSYAYYYAHQYDRALAQMNKTLEVEPAALHLYGDMGAVYAQMGAYDQALAACQKALSAQRDDPEGLSALGRTYALSRKGEEAEQTIETLKQVGKNRYVQPYLVAVIYAALDKRDETFLWLDKAKQERSWELFSLLRVDPALDRIRSDSRYEPFLQSVYRR